MHGDKSQGQRERALARFERGEVEALVATDVAARGIDVADITHVINYDAPEDRDAYVHRIGRTGRAGRTGTGISFVLADQADEMRRIAGGPRARPRVRASVARARRPPPDRPGRAPRRAAARTEARRDRLQRRQVDLRRLRRVRKPHATSSRRRCRAPGRSAPTGPFASTAAGSARRRQASTPPPTRQPRTPAPGFGAPR